MRSVVAGHGQVSNKPKRNLTFDHAAEKVSDSDSDSGRSRAPPLGGNPQAALNRFFRASSVGGTPRRTAALTLHSREGEAGRRCLLDSAKAISRGAPT
jgi:hypothetical protein